jgi:hypothetical protein
MLTRIQISAFLGLSAALWVGMLAARGVPLSWEMLGPFSGVVGGVSLILLIFDAWAWRLPIFRGWLIKRPILVGVWRVELQSNWINPETDAGMAPIHCFMIIRQTASAISFRLVTPESTSETVSAGIEICSDGTFEISCTYRNKPRSAFRHRSQVHYGAMLLNADGLTPTRLEGEYWTDRNTLGSVVLTERKKGAPMTFDEAAALFIDEGA